jgi:uncharacterized membrane protein (UPF0127 family)
MSKGASEPTIVVENVTRKRVIAGQVWAAADSATRRRGLLDVSDLDLDAGIWINPCEAIHTFGMQMELDIVFLDARLRVKKISAHLKPNRIAFCLAARSVLEIRAGSADASGLQCGDQLLFRQGNQPNAADDFVR